jgi:hypothetical protein
MTLNPTRVSTGSRKNFVFLKVRDANFVSGGIYCLREFVALNSLFNPHFKGRDAEG